MTSDDRKPRRILRRDRRGDSESIALQTWQIAEIEAGLAQADAGEFAGDADVARVTGKFRPSVA